jgi:hypothetical protein
MPNISLTDFKATQEAAERRKRLAAALQEQATAPIQIQSYNGIQAPIPVTEVLVKALQGYLGGRQQKKAEEALATGRTKARTEAMDFVRGLKQETPQDRFIAPPNFQPEQPGFIDRLKRAGQSFMPQQAPQPAPPPQPMVAPPQSAPMAPAQPMPMPQPAQPEGPYSGYNGPGPMDVSELRQIPAELQNRARSPEEQQQMLMDAAMSGNPYLESIAPRMYEDIQDQQAAIADRERKMGAIMGLDLPDDQKAALMAELDLGDSKLLSQFNKPPVPIQSPEGVIGLVAQKVAQGQPLTKGEQDIWNIYTARERKRAYIAPRGGGGSGGGSGGGAGGGGGNATMNALETELRRRGILK